MSDKKTKPQTESDPAVGSSALLEIPPPELSPLGLKAWKAGYRGHELRLPDEYSYLLTG